MWNNALAGTNYTVQTVSSLPGGTNWVDYVQLPVTNNVNTNRLVDFKPPTGMVIIPAGSFTMGNATGDGDILGASLTTVTVSAFYMDVNLVTSNLWLSVYTFATNCGYTFVHPGAAAAGNQPIVLLDWYDCVKWCNARSAQAGLTPVYYTDGGLTKVYTNGDSGTTVYANWGVNGYRLPTESEWEKAARGGVSGLRFPWGNTIAESQANYFGNTSYSYDLGPNGFNAIGNYPTSFPGTSAGGSFAPNGYRLNDMAGNVMQWCWDWYATPYAGGSDPRGPTGPLVYRTYRGGYWEGEAAYARCAQRGYGDPHFSNYGSGFRCVRGH